MFKGLAFAAMVTFSPQGIVRASPFKLLDILYCHNLLIYFAKSLHKNAHTAIPLKS